jgi:hypothetical protein
MLIGLPATTGRRLSNAPSSATTTMAPMKMPVAVHWPGSSFLPSSDVLAP